MTLQFLKTSRFGLAALLVVGFMLAQGAAAASVSELKTIYAQSVTTYQAAKTQFSATKQTVLQSPSKTWTPDLIGQTKTMVGAGNQMLVAYLNWMEQKSGQMEGLPSSTTSEVLAAVNADRAWLFDHAAKLEKATTKAEVIELGKELQRQWTSQRNQFRKFHLQIAAAKLTATLDRGDASALAFEKIIVSVKTAGIDATGVETSVNAAKESLRLSRQSAEAATDKLSMITELASAGSVLGETDQMLKESSEHLKIASQGFSDALSSLKILQTK